jgi:hypothetical protein
METSYLPIARLDELPDDKPTHAMADGIDLALVRRAGEVHAFDGRCPHRGALLATEEPYVSEIHRLAKKGLPGAHGAVAAMGELPSWDDVQVLTAQLHRFPRLDEEPVDTSVTIGPATRRPLRPRIPVFVSDMSFGAISLEAETALTRGAEGAGTGPALRHVHADAELV